MQTYYLKRLLIDSSKSSLRSLHINSIFKNGNRNGFIHNNDSRKKFILTIEKQTSGEILKRFRIKNRFFIYGSIGSITGISLLIKKQNQKTNCIAASLVEEEIQIKKETIRETQLRILLVDLMFPESIYFVIAALASFLSSLFISNQSTTLGKIFDCLTKGQDVTGSLIKMMSLVLGQACMGFISSFSLAIAVTKLGTNLRTRLFDSILKQDIETFDTINSGELNQMLGNDVSNLQTTIRTLFTSGIESITTLLSGAFALYQTSPLIASTMFIALPLGTISANLLAMLLSGLSEQTRKASGKSSNLANESILSIKTVRAFGAEEREKQRYIQSLNLVAFLKMKMAAFTGAFITAITLGINLSSVLVISIGKSLVASGNMTAGDIVGILSNVKMLESAFAKISVVSVNTSKALSSSEHLFSLLIKYPKTNTKGEGIKEIPIVQNNYNRGSKVEFKNVTFAYPSRKDQVVLDQVSFVVEPGQYVSIVGGSGSGKTTTMSLLERFYDAIDGKILIDGIDIKEIDPELIHNIMTIVPQQPDLFSCSIYDNIKYGKPNATEEEVREAARKANCLEFIESFPNKFQTLCGERGASLSGGQRQRLAIARALLLSPKILILDECTSALDSESEHQIQQALKELMKGKTVIAISHRLATIKNADKIVVLEHGKVVEEGTHQDLMQNLSGVYHILFRKQQQGIQRNDSVNNKVK